MELRDLSREELIAFCINIYNALVVHATVAIGPAANALARCARACGLQGKILGPGRLAVGSAAV